MPDTVNAFQPKLTEEQHFVPKFYLRKFVNRKGEVEILDCKRNEITKSRGVDGICYESYFYGLETGQPDEVSQEVEKSFQVLENGLAKDLDKIIPSLLNNEQITEDRKWLISLLMSMNWTRGPVMRRMMNRMQEDVIKHMAGFHFSHPILVKKLFDKFDQERGETTSPELQKKYKNS